MNIYKKIILFGLIFLFVISLLFFIYREFQIKKLIVIGDPVKLTGLSILDNNNLLFVSEQKISAYLQNQNPKVLKIKIFKKFPSTLIFEVYNRKPIAQIINNSGHIYIDREGVLLEEENNYPDLPKISVSDISIYSNQKVDWRVRKIISFIEETGKQGIKTSQITVSSSSDNFAAQAENGTEVLLPLDADMTLKASSLQVIVQRFKIMGKNIVKIDFRFDKPLVTLANGEKISSYE